MKDMKGITIGYVACKGQLIGVFTLSDSCRTGSAEAIRELRSLGIKSVMLTGDSAAAASYAQNQVKKKTWYCALLSFLYNMTTYKIVVFVFWQLGNILDGVHSELLPEDKVRIVDELKAKHGPTLMIGDGMNDAPALAKADVGVSMGVSGSAVAMETSHITLMSNDIRRIPKAVQLARRTHRTIIVNVIFSVITKLAIVGLALSGHPLIWAAVLADVGTCMLVIMYSMLLLRSKGGRKAKKCCASSQHGSHAKKHCVSRHCSDGPCKSTGCSKESSAGKHGCHDHGHAHSHCKEPSNQQPTEKHACHDHGHSHNHCKEPSSHVVTEKHVCHDHGNTHNHCKEAGNQLLVESHGCHDHDHGHSHDHTVKQDCHDHEHSHCKEPKTPRADSEGACHGHGHGRGHEHRHCEGDSHSHGTCEHGCHEREHSHCEEHSHLHPTIDHACEHQCHAEQQTVHTAETHHCHDHDHEHGQHKHDHGEIEEPEKDCHDHSHHCCHEPHDKDKIAAEPVEEVTISIAALPKDEGHHHSEEHKGEHCGKAKDCGGVPTPTDCAASKNCCSVKGGDTCSSLQAACAKEISPCCRSYVKCPRTAVTATRSSCCDHSMLKLPEIVVE